MCVFQRWSYNSTVIEDLDINGFYKTYFKNWQETWQILIYSIKFQLTMKNLVLFIRHLIHEIKYLQVLSGVH